MKINWGQGIAIFMVTFMIFILSYVYKTFTNDSYDHHLVSEQYYKDTLHYQEEIDELDNASKLNINVVLEKTDKGVELTFPSDLGAITGHIQFQRPSNVKFDINKTIELVDNKLIIPDDILARGIYNIKIRWKANDVRYLFKEKLTY